MSDTQMGQFQFIDCSSITIKKENIEDDLQFLTDNQVKVKEEFVEDGVETFQLGQYVSEQTADCEEEPDFDFPWKKELNEKCDESHKFLEYSLQTDSQQCKIERDRHLTCGDDSESADRKSVCKTNSESYYQTDDCQKTSQTYKCKICGESFPLFLDFMKHQITHQQVKEKPSCTSCGKGFKTRQSYNHHRCRSPKGSVFFCKKCNAKFHNNRILIFHKCLDAITGSYSCHACDKTFDTKKSLGSHKRSHLESSSR